MITAPSSVFALAHVIYQIRSPQLGKDIIYVGMCPLAELAALPDARRNSEFDRIIKPNDIIQVMIWASCGDVETCRHQHEILVRSLKPHCNIIGTELPTIAKRSRRSVTCVNTGETYKTAKEAAEAHDVSGAAMSQHLSGKLATLAGLTFTRGEQ